MQTEAAELSVNHQTHAVELKGSVFTLPILQIRSTSIARIEIELGERLKNALKFFDNAAVVIDLEKISSSEEELDFTQLMRLLSQHALIPVGVRNGSSRQNALAVSAGLAILKGGVLQDIVSSDAPVDQKRRKDDSAPEPTIVSTSSPTKIVKSPVRSGQQIYAMGADLIVLAPVNPGAEIIADGNIHVYAPMRGRALAGVRGDVNARIFCQNMEAELVSIAGNFRVFEDTVPAEIRSKIVQIFLEGEQLMISPLK